MMLPVFLSEGGGFGDLGIGKSDVPIGDAALYALIGFLIVILVLALLVCIFYLSGFLFKTAARKSKNKDRQKQEPEHSAQSDETDEQLLAVITAAISAVYDSEAQEGEDKPDFVIRRISRNK